MRFRTKRISSELANTHRYLAVKTTSLSGSKNNPRLYISRVKSGILTVVAAGDVVEVVRVRVDVTVQHLVPGREGLWDESCTACMDESCAPAVTWSRPVVPPIPAATAG